MKNKKGILFDWETKRRKSWICQNILKQNISWKNILFTDETKIEIGSYINDSIRLSEETRENENMEKKMLSKNKWTR